MQNSRSAFEKQVNPLLVNKPADEADHWPPSSLVRSRAAVAGEAGAVDTVRYNTYPLRADSEPPERVADGTGDGRNAREPRENDVVDQVVEANAWSLARPVV